jgi:hypothetical protein
LRQHTKFSVYRKFHKEIFHEANFLTEKKWRIYECVVAVTSDL